MLGLTTKNGKCLGKSQSADSWTDEYVTVIITLPLVLVFVCTFVAILFAKPELLEASDAAIASVKVRCYLVTMKYLKSWYLLRWVSKV